MDYLYHGSVTPNIKILEPRKRYTPQGINLSAIYATPLPAFAAAHAFPWSTDEGIDLDVVDGKVILIVPEKIKERLGVQAYIYKVSAEKFEHTKDDVTGYTYHTISPTEVISVEEFETIEQAIQKLGGEVQFN